ncbi:hypothetical protein JET76_14465 [Pseudomonas putida]|uniref:Uncharacterized protein n=1 Tax=Pseudomonas putida TaxID=303 RepID=A0A7W2KY98_PSEPU|nr:MULTISPECIES: hypothetical protein [Pseudomonas]MBA6114786.1 hypothetical protein [Pseudomonas putida]MBI6942552.1 hypothetical protein [Pseudomonas putida]MBI6960281.1 hypothetical protein [Pseudomonas putida]MCZ9639019.1 hypothetical protein [Pseudomonas putida]MEC4875882.1 hypothetical protein [Pseudomonas sp. NC26]
MSDVGEPQGSRAAFHRQHQAQALAQAEYLLARRDEMQSAWVNWVAAQLYQLGPPPYVAMVRRELQRLTQG